MPSKRVIILEQADEAGRFHYLLWADVPTERQPFYAQPGKVSAWKDASGAENAALASGAVVEFSDVAAVPPGATLAQIQAGLQARWIAYQAQITALNRWNRYGSVWDGTSWIAGGVT